MQALPIFDPLSESFARDPHVAYAKLRDLPEPFYYADVDSWMLTKAAEVEAVALNKTMLRNRDHLLSETDRKEAQRKMNWHDMPHHERFVQTNLLESEGETHSRLRKLVFREFSAAMIARQRETIQAFVDHLLDGLSGRSEFDFIEDFAAHVPGYVIGRVIGVPDEDCPQLRTWSEQVVRFFNVGCNDNDKHIAEQATKEFYEYLLTLMDARGKAPKEDLMSRMVEHRDAGRMTEEELVATTMLILMAGHGSTIDVLGSGMHALLRFPDQHKKLRDDPGLINLAVQEMFRFESPLPYFHRFATEKTVVGGRTFEAGTRFGLLYGAANRDPDRFENADQFDVNRSPNRHIAFGGGTHFCLGNHLARLDMNVIFTTLNERFSSIELKREPTYKPGLSARGPITLDIVVQRN